MSRQNIIFDPLKRQPVVWLGHAGLRAGSGRAWTDTNQLFTIVGYGDQAIIPHLAWSPIPYDGTPQLVELNSAWSDGFNIHLSGNNGRRARGGACFGDSGGPAVVNDTNIVGGVASFVLNDNCTGASFYYRVDTADAQDFILPFLQ